MNKYILLLVLCLSVIPVVADEYIDPATNIIYVYKLGNPSATVKSGNRVDRESGTEYVSGNPNVRGNISILDKFTVNGVEYVVDGIGDFSFVLNKDITSVYMPSTIKIVGMESFLGCSLLESVSMSEGLKTIGQRSFEDCISLLSLVFPKGLEEIGFEAFQNCKSLKSVHFSSSVNNISSLLFYGCDNLEFISVEEGNKTFDSREGSNAVIETATNRLVIGCKETVIPHSVISVGKQAFYGCVNLEKIIIPKTVNIIETAAFCHCKNLTQLLH